MKTMLNANKNLILSKQISRLHLKAVDELSQFIRSLDGQPFTLKNSALHFVVPHTPQGKIIYHHHQDGSFIVHGFTSLLTLYMESFQRGVNFARSAITLALMSKEGAKAIGELPELLAEIRSVSTRATEMTAKKISMEQRKLYREMKEIVNAQAKDGEEQNLAQASRKMKKNHRWSETKRANFVRAFQKAGGMSMIF